MEASEANTSEEAYEAFKARMLREFDVRQAGQPPSLQQKLLRTHLRDFLQSVGPQDEAQNSEMEQYAGVSQETDAVGHDGAHYGDKGGRSSGDCADVRAKDHINIGGDGDQSESWFDDEAGVEAWTQVDPYAQAVVVFDGSTGAASGAKTSPSVGFGAQAQTEGDPDSKVKRTDHLHARVEDEKHGFGYPDDWLAAEGPNDTDHCADTDADAEFGVDEAAAASEAGVDTESGDFFETRINPSSEDGTGGDIDAEAKVEADPDTGVGFGDSTLPTYGRTREVGIELEAVIEGKAGSTMYTEDKLHPTAKVKANEGSADDDEDLRQTEAGPTGEAEVGCAEYVGSDVVEGLHSEIGLDYGGGAEVGFACAPNAGERVELTCPEPSCKHYIEVIQEAHFYASTGSAEAHHVDDGAEIGVTQAHPADPAKRKVTARRAANEQRRRLALERAAMRSRRQVAAHRIQRVFRDRQKNTAARDITLDDVELLSTSMFIPIIKEPQVCAPEMSKTTQHRDPPAESLLAIPSVAPLFEVVVELLAARGLVTGSPSSTLLHSKYVEAEMRIKCKSLDIARIVGTSQRLVNSHPGDISWDKCLLRFAIDPSNRDGVDPQSVIDDWNAHIIVKSSNSRSGRIPTGGNGGSRVLGVVDVPLSLLETPMASQYAMCRWFPLEKSYPGHTARGEIRLRVCYLMRHLGTGSINGNDSIVSGAMIPYAPTVKAQSPPNVPEDRRRSDKNNSFQRKSKPPKTTSALQPRLRGLSRRSNQLNPTAFRRSDDRTVDSSAQKSNPPPPPFSLSSSLPSSATRISRAEALSPPSSPSSTSSEIGGESALAAAVDRNSEVQMKSRKQIISPKRPRGCAKPIEVRPTVEPEATAITKETTGSPRNVRQPFLKRKPYQVVFRKLDWSSVASKTDSNWPMTSSGSGLTMTTTNAQPTETQYSRASAAGKSTEDEKKQAPPKDHRIELSGLPISERANGKVYINEETGKRLATLEKLVLEQCHLTASTASLARMKFQSDRKKFVTALQKQMQAQRPLPAGEFENEFSPPPCTETEASKSTAEDESGLVCQTLNATVAELWRKLTADTPGEFYATILQSFMGDQSQLTDAAEHAAAT